MFVGDLWQVVTDMGFVQRFGVAFCRGIVGDDGPRRQMDVEKILEQFALYAARTDQINRRIDDGTFQ
jgi:hypothetical protein